MKSTALAALAERTASTAPTTADTAGRWNAYDVWLSRVRPPRDIVTSPTPDTAGSSTALRR